MILLYFGSFNPVHIGHLIIAQEALARTAAEELWFVLSPCNPLKRDKGLASEKNRVEMLEKTLACYDFGKSVSVCDIEFGMPRPSYTIDTLDKLRNTYSGVSFGMLIGEDNLRLFDRWKSYDRILDTTSVFVYARNGWENEIISPEIAAHPNLTLWQNVPLLEISSSLVRNKIANADPFGVYLPSGVAEYIKEHGLYRD